MSRAGPQRASSIARWLIVSLVAGGAVALVYGVDPARTTWLPKCPLHEMTGWHCPGCGSTRAAHALLHGDVRGAIAFNALLVCGAPLAVAVWTNGCLRQRKTLAEWSTTLSPRWIWTIVAVGAAFAILRNLPWYPFELLAPH